MGRTSSAIATTKKGAKAAKPPGPQKKAGKNREADGIGEVTKYIKLLAAKEVKMSKEELHELKAIVVAHQEAAQERARTKRQETQELRASAKRNLDQIFAAVTKMKSDGGLPKAMAYFDGGVQGNESDAADLTLTKKMYKHLSQYIKKGEKVSRVQRIRETKVDTSSDALST